MSLRRASWAARPSLAQGPEQARHHAAWLQRQRALCDDLTWAGRFCEAVPIAGAGPADYLPARLEVGDVEALVGLRFYGGDPERAFVDLIAVTRPLDDPTRAALAAACLERYRRFAPRRLRVVRWLDAAAPPPPLLPNVEVDQWLVAGQLGALAGRPRPPEDVGVSARVATVHELEVVADAVAAWYEAWTAREPWRAGRVFPADIEALHGCADQGALVVLEASSAPVAVAAAALEPEPTTGLMGWCMHALAVDPQRARRGLGQRVQRALIDALEGQGEGGRLLYGTIDDANHGSRSAARRCGRRALARFEFHPLTSPAPTSSPC